MFQGPAGAKGDKGERVSHPTHTIQPLFRANQVLFYSLMLHNNFFLLIINLQYTFTVSRSSFAQPFI